jgi:UDP-N-acetylmuramoyl-tripeptide--D-alanyl-D-alanine ligase
MAGGRGVIPLDLETVAALTGGRLAGEADPATVVTGPVETDSRACSAGSLFVALPGEHADGHDFAEAAVRAGASAALVTRPVGLPAVLVEDTERALGLLAAGVLDRTKGCRVVGVTGSAGKTSTKDLLAQIFERVGPTVAPAASFNNEIGLPLTVLRVTSDTRTLVLEYSARGTGHIAYLTTIARPDVALVLNIGTAHLGEFGSREAIAEAKGELVESVAPSGHVVLNADDPLVLGMQRRAAAPVTTFGTSGPADVRLEELTLDEQARASFRLVTGSDTAHVRMRLHGRHHALNAVAAAAAAVASGVDLATVASALESAEPRSSHRMAVVERADGLLVIDDAYNASPESMRAGIDALVALAGGRHTIAVLGEMRELGSSAPELHRQIGAYAVSAGVDEVVAVGAGAPIAAAVRAEGGRAEEVADADAAVELLAGRLGARDALLVKASNTIRLWTVAERIIAAAPAEARA